MSFPWFLPVRDLAESGAGVGGFVYRGGPFSVGAGQAYRTGPAAEPFSDKGLGPPSGRGASAPALTSRNQNEKLGGESLFAENRRPRPCWIPCSHF